MLQNSRDRKLISGWCSEGGPSGHGETGARTGAEGSAGFREAMGREVTSQAEGNSMRQELIKSAFTLEGHWVP